MKTINIKKTLEKIKKQFETASIENPLLDAKVLLKEALSLSDIDLLTKEEIEVSLKDYEKLENYVKKRMKRQPISYIINEKEFMSLPFYIEEGYFTPRPDTEHVVEHTLKLLENMKPENEFFHVLDYCTGTGAIALSLAYYNEKVMSYGYDDKMRNIKNTEKFPKIDLLPVINADKLKVGDRFIPIKLGEISTQGVFDIIVSNPPYIPTKDLEGLEEEVLVEPHHALDGGIDGLDTYREIIAYSKNHLRENGFIVFEIGYDQREDLFQLLEEANYKNITCYKDYGDLDRVIIGQKEGV